MMIPRFLIILLFSVLSSNSIFPYQPKELKIGSKAPMTDHKVTDVSGRSLTIGEVAQENGLLVLFTCNTCPWVTKWEDRYIEISSNTKLNKIGMIALNPNEGYRLRGDGLEEMGKRVRKANYDFPYALDKDHQIADAFGVSRTPQVYLFNANLELVYVGAIDDNADSAISVKENYLKNAIQQLIAGEQIKKPNTKTTGCTIKRAG
ncbi:MAG: redoxin domain-containing protein [Balneolaceae bacterium]